METNNQFFVTFFVRMIKENEIYHFRICLFLFMFYSVFFFKFLFMFYSVLFISILIVYFYAPQPVLILQPMFHPNIFMLMFCHIFNYQCSTVKYVFLSDIIPSKAISTGYGRDRSQESFQRVPKIFEFSKLHNYHFFTTLVFRK